MSTPGEILEALGREARSRLGNGRDTATRVYRGRSVEELVPQIQRDLGPDAIILRRREGLTGGVLGFFQRAFVEIEAMPGGPGVDLYDEQLGETPPAAPEYTQERYAPESLAPQSYTQEPYAQDPAGQMPAVQYQQAPQTPPLPTQAPPLPVQAPPPVAQPVAESQPPPPLPAEAPPVPSSLPQRPTFEYRSAAMRPQTPVPPALVQPPRPTTPAAAASSSPTVAEPLPSPFYTRQATPAPAAAAGSAYVTAHLAALARAERAKGPPRGPIPERREDTSAWASDFQELIPREQTETFPRPAASVPAQQRAASERRVVAPGSQGRARAGVAKSLQRCGISEELAHELIDAAGAHALALAPRAGLVQAVRATLAQRIPVAPPLATKGAAIVVIGAGGAGKTTFCMTLLGAYRRSSSLPASYATIAREGERGELQLLLAPHIVKPTPASAPNSLRALRRARSDGMAILDTPSLSPSDRGSARELARLLGEMTPERVVVALPATLGATAAAQLLKALAPLGANTLAITHADETDQLGVAVEAACRFGLAPEYMLERGRGGGWRLRQLTPTVLVERLLP
jgi:flagellar biosynthesis GTPase FlhF